MTTSKFKDIKIGDTAKLTRVITQKDLDIFAELTGDINKLHTDNDYTKKTHLKKPVAHGMLGMSFISALIGTKLPGNGALWYSQNTEFKQPVRIGDKITAKVEVINKINKLNAIEVSTEIINQHKQLVTTGTAKIKIVEPQTSTNPNKPKTDRKTALIVGSTGGIGEVTSLRLARDGFDLVLHYNSDKKMALNLMHKVSKLGRKADIFKADITDESQVEELVNFSLRKFRHITALINCATIKVPNIKFPNLEWSDIENHFDINIKGSFNLVKHLVPAMEDRDYGKIIFLTTQYIETPPSELLHYVTAKSALSGFSKSLAVELASKGIRINLVSAGMTDTKLISDIPEKIQLLTSQRTPLKRLANPIDVANAISFLASPDSDFLTGETIRVNGGQVML